MVTESTFVWYPGRYKNLNTILGYDPVYMHIKVKWRQCERQ